MGLHAELMRGLSLIATLVLCYSACMKNPDPQGHVDIDSSVTSIPEKAFFQCTKLKSITFASSVTTIGAMAFAESGLYYVVIPDTVTSIGDEAFRQCSEMTTASTGAGVTSIPSKAFYQCSALEEMSIGSKVKSIGDEAFYQCSALASVTLPDALTTMGSKVFYQNTALATVTFGTGLSSVNVNTFVQCNHLKTVYINAQVFDCSSLALSITDSADTGVQFVNTATSITNLDGVDCDGSRCGCEPGYGNLAEGSQYVACTPCPPAFYQAKKYCVVFCDDCDQGYGTCGTKATKCAKEPLPCVPTTAPTPDPTYSHAPTMKPTALPTVEPSPAPDYVSDPPAYSTPHLRTHAQADSRPNLQPHTAAELSPDTVSHEDPHAGPHA
jgi:hypothetical protein